MIAVPAPMPVGALLMDKLEHPSSPSSIMNVLPSSQPAKPVKPAEPIDEAALFKEMEEALREDVRCGNCDSDDECDPNIAYGSVTYLTNGDIHVCPGATCPHAVYNEEHMLVCDLSGVVIGYEMVHDYMESVSGHKPSNCPDDHAGEPVGGKFAPKKDMYGLSQQAYLAAATLEEGSEQSPKTLAAPPPVKSTQKRGALCVDELPQAQDDHARKRARANKRNVEGREGYIALVDEAAKHLTTLVNYEKKTPSKPPRAPVVEDVRLCDPNFLFGAAIKRYVKECLSTGASPTLDAVHNLSIMAHDVAARETKKVEEAKARIPKLLQNSVKEACAKLVVALWFASCKTSYMDSSKRGNDSFRPFACGVFYALKRGVSLPDGRVVVPRLPESVTEALPALRSTTSNSMAKTLHSSSHRGLCTLHKCVNSVAADSSTRFLFTEAADRARELAALLKNA